MTPGVWAIGLATGALALGYAANGEWLGGALMILIGALLWIAQRRRWSRSASLHLAHDSQRAPNLINGTAGLIVFTASAALGLLRGASTFAMLVGTLAALAAWDLDHFERRLRTAQRVEAQGALIRAHLRRLSIVAGLGLTLGGIALSVQVEITFGWALLLGLLAFLALSGVIAFGQREREG
jgi:hypothetical protein